ncbi:MAG: iron ABC transporter permease [Planctomycetes bacterium]|nr:iron ABC transporter permease [Planctomycetota bacterium]
MHRRVRNTFLVLGLLLAATTVVTPLIGSAGVPLGDVFWQLRVPRLALAMLAGGVLATAGAVFQGTFRNPLATPFTLGVSSGAALFVAVGVTLGGKALDSSIAQTALALSGAALTVCVVFGIARLRPGAAVTTLLLAGISISFICSAGVALVLALAGEHAIAMIVRWTMGSVEIVGAGAWRVMAPATVVAVVAGGVIARVHRDLDLIMMGELVAAGRGVNVRRARASAYFAASAMTGAVVALCGPIAFVGLVVPHVMRAVLGPLHARLLPACVLGGMIFLPVCDTIAHHMLPWLTNAGVLAAVGLPANSAQLPVGVLTNLLGGLFFLYLLLTYREERPLV